MAKSVLNMTVVMVVLTAAVQAEEHLANLAVEVAGKLLPSVGCNRLRE